MLAATNLFRVDQLLVQIYNSEVEMAEKVAEIAQNYLQQILEQQQTAAVLLATGNSQLKFLDAFIGLGGVDWSRITLFHLDEYL
ncbi:MAG: glucosamine-6-phosphate deaminase, partial [Nodularia sp. (in: Bacteria)]